VVILNAGLVHRVGPFGLSVQIARRLASQGFRVLRFDLSGLGDSPARTSALSVEERSILDGCAALDFLAEHYGAKSFVVGGICTGATNAHRLCLHDERVTAIYLLDGYAYTTMSYYRQRVMRRLTELREKPKSAGRLALRVVTKLRGRLLGKLKGAQPTGRDPRIGLFYQVYPHVSVVRAELDRMLARGVRMLFVYTGGWQNFVSERQFDEMFPKLARRNQVTVRYHERADHTYLAREDQETLFHDLHDFVTRCT
jgi:pimeloyl-ACP methyl ester carboxylesterase